MRGNELIGEKFGRLTVIGKGIKIGQSWRALCRCECGTEKHILRHMLTRGHTKSCGCLHREVVSKLFSTHGLSDHPLYSVWCHIQGRCNSPKVKEYPYYGGRGIKVCERWQKFENFLADVGERPFIKASLDRINNDGDYEPSNVRWATTLQQGRNKRNNRLITFNNKTQPLSVWAEEIGLKMTTIRQRIDAYGWSIEKALTVPKLR